jgi:hypothetical protein
MKPSFFASLLSFTAFIKALPFAKLDFVED